MRVLIVEDEVLAAERLASLLKQCAPDAEVVDQFDSVEDTVRFFRSGNAVDLLLLDIQLADGKSFEIFDKANIDVPVIFTTAYDQYALHAFRFLSIDYLLKPVSEDHLCSALEKLRKLGSDERVQAGEIRALRELILSTRREYRERFLIKTGNKLLFKVVEDVAYFYADGKVVYLVTRDSRRFMVDHTLEELEQTLDPSKFFRISRKAIVGISSIAEVRGMISGRLEIRLSQTADQPLEVSRERASTFKKWLNN